MSRINVSSGSPFEEPIGFSRAVRIENIISVSGTAPIKPNGSTFAPGDMYKQTKYCIKIMKKAIEEAGGHLDNIIRTRVFLKDVSRWKEAAKAHGEFFSNIRPASTFVEVKGFMSVGYARKRLEYKTMPNWKEVQDYAKQIAKASGMKVLSKHEFSRVVLLGKSKKQMKIRAP